MKGDRVKKGKQRLPKGVVEKLSKNIGGGTHSSKRDYDRKRSKHELRRLIGGLG